MNTKLLVALGVCVALGVSYFATRSDHVKVGVRELKLPEFSAKEIDQISIGQSSPVRLVRHGESWWVQAKMNGMTKLLPANAQYVASLLDAAAKVEGNYFVSERVDKQEALGLTTALATPVTLYAFGKPAWRLLVGNDAEEGKHVRLSDSEAMFVARGRFADLVRLSIDEWRERKVLPLVEAQVRRLEVQADSQTPLKFTRGDEQWPQVARLVNDLVNLRAHAFVDAQPEKTVARVRLRVPAYTVILEDDKGTLHKLWFAKSEDGSKCWVMTAAREDIDEVSDYIMKQLDLALRPRAK
jgi:hypothetical protein